jgi:hypothetical protein
MLFRDPSPRVRFLLAALLAASVAVGFLIGCGRDQTPPTGPASPAAVAPSSPRSHRIAGAEAPDVALTIEVQNRNWPQLRTLPGVVGSATSLDADGTPVILVLVDGKGRPGVPASLEGITVRTEVTGTPVPFAPPPPPPLVLMGSSTANDYDPIRQINCTNSGTLGCTVMSGHTAYFLSCNHVFANANLAAIGDPIVSPSRADNHDGNPCGPSQVVATLYDFEPISHTGVNLIDAAIAKVGKKTNYTCAMRSGYTPTSNPAEAQIGMAVKKTGRTTYVTQGTVTGLNAAVSVSYVSGGGYFEGQIVIEGAVGAFSLPGDSGALMVSDPVNDPVGLVFAGDPTDGNPTFANPIQPVLDRFNVTVCSN